MSKLWEDFYKAWAKSDSNLKNALYLKNGDSLKQISYQSQLLALVHKEKQEIEQEMKDLAEEKNINECKRILERITKFRKHWTVQKDSQILVGSPKSPDAKPFHLRGTMESGKKRRDELEKKQWPPKNLNKLDFNDREEAEEQHKVEEAEIKRYDELADNIEQLEKISKQDELYKLWRKLESKCHRSFREDDIQCRGTTKAGKRCRNYADETGYCWLHKNQ